MKKNKYQEWGCKKTDPNKSNGMEYECSAKRGKEISIFRDGSIRINNEDYPIKINGKKVKVEGEEAYGVEVN